MLTLSRKKGGLNSSGLKATARLPCAHKRGKGTEEHSFSYGLFAVGEKDSPWYTELSFPDRINELSGERIQEGLQGFLLTKMLEVQCPIW